MEENSKTKSGISRFKRIIAGILALLTAASTVLYTQTSIVLNSEALNERTQLLAAAQLLQTNEYAEMSRLGRISAYMKYYLSLAKSYEEYELGASIAIAQGNFEDAEACTAKAIETSPEDKNIRAELYYRMAYLQILMEDESSAMGWLNKGLEAKPKAEAYLVRAQIAAANGEGESAMADLRRYELIYGRNAKTAVYSAGICEAAGEYALAEEYYNLALEGADADKSCYLNRAHCRMEQGNFDGAEEDGKEYLRYYGEEKAHVSEMLGMGYMSAGVHEKATEQFVQAVEATAEPDATLLYYTALCAFIDEDYSLTRQYGEAAAEKAAAGSAPGRLQLQLDANGTIQVTSQGAALADLYRITAIAMMYTAEYKKAITYFDECMRAPDGVDTAGNLSYLRAVCEMAVGDYDKAIADLDAAITKGADKIGCIYSKGVCLKETGNTNQAEIYLNEVVLTSDDAELKNKAAELLRDMKTPEETEQNKGENKK